jgi:hypothetical protein
VPTVSDSLSLKGGQIDSCREQSLL